MPWSAGAFTRTNGVHTGATLWTQDRDAGTKILASRHDTHDQDLAGGINSTLEKSGSNAATGNLNIGSNRLTAVADGTAKTDAATVNQLQSNAPAFQATDTGTANAHVIALSPAITAYAAGQAITFKSGAASTTSSTLNVNGLGVKTIKKKNDQNIAAGDIESGSIVTVVYDGTNFQMTSQGATDEGLDLGAVSGIIESNANFVDMCIVGPSVDGVSWNGHFSKASVWTSLMLATVETSGSDAQVNIWDLASNVLASATPLATLTLSGATPTSIAASMGYLIVGTSDQGMHIVDPHGGAWAERTDGYPRSLTASTVPALTSNNVIKVAVGFGQQPPFDPRTGGRLPAFATGYPSAAGKTITLIQTDGTVTTPDSGQTCEGVGFAKGHVLFNRGDGNDILTSSQPIEQESGTAFGHTSQVRNATVGAYLKWLGSDNALDVLPNGSVVGADTNGASIVQLDNLITPSGLSAEITRTYNTGFRPIQLVLSALANSDTADRSGNSNTLTENGTVTEAVVASGAELKGYSGFTTSNYLSRAYDADFDFGTGSLSIALWFKSAGNDSDQAFIHRRDTSHSGTEIKMRMLTNGKINFQLSGSGSPSPESVAAYDDGEWHFAVGTFDSAATITTLNIDGGGEIITSATDPGNLDNGSAVLRIGLSPNDASPADDSTLSLVRMSASTVSASQIRRMYEAEAPMFAANAKVLLQSGSTDAVLDAEIDPLSGKVIVTQTDSQEIFNGLAIETERTIATGGSTFEHGLLWGDAVSEINNANLFASTPATDQRQVNEMVRSLSADLPAGVDMSKAKAWVVVDQSSGVSLLSSYNVESVADTAGGRCLVTFAVPFKSRNYSAVGGADGATMFGISTGSAWTTGTAELRTRNSSNSLTDSAYVAAAFFGELENE